MTKPVFEHKSVLAEEAVSSLNLQKGDCVIDCTAGGGGHSRSIWEAIGPDGQLICLDRDPQAIQHLKEFFGDLVSDKKVLIIKNTFSNLKQIANMLRVTGKVAAILADIGVSSPQLDQAERGFSFGKAGPLDMRMDPTQGESASDVVNTKSERELQLIFQNYGEEKFSRRIAQRIVQERNKAPITTTDELARIISAAVPPTAKGQKNPATQVFQALRIYVNAELDELKSFLDQSLEVLKPEGRLAIITFHSLEDRIVKNFFKEKEGSNVKDPMLKYLPIRQDDIQAEAKIIKPFPIVPSDDEINRNIRSRSAKLRVLEKKQSVKSNERSR